MKALWMFVFVFILLWWKIPGKKHNPYNLKPVLASGAALFHLILVHLGRLAFLDIPIIPIYKRSAWVQIWVALQKINIIIISMMLYNYKLKA